MGRLYYKKDNTASLESGTTRGVHEENESESKEFLEKVGKIIPAEIIAGYVAIVGLVPSIKNTSIHTWVYYGAFFMCLLLTPIYLWFQADKDKPRPIIHIILSIFSFIVWAYCVTGAQIVPHLYEAPLASIALIGYSLLTGWIPFK